MGYFSWDCPCCHNSVRSHSATTADSQWMSRAVAVFEGGTLLRGEYDGFGGVGNGHYELDVGEDFALYHEACWLLTGKPAFSQPSRHAHDQGHFVGEYDPTEPKSEADLAAMRQDAAQKKEAHRQMWKEARLRATQSSGNSV